jgi:hypothetical protein
VHDRLSEQIATLPSLNKTQLLAIWAENFSKDPPPNLRKESFFSEGSFLCFCRGFWGKRVFWMWFFDGKYVVDCGDFVVN